MLKAQIEDGLGSGRKAMVDDQRGVVVSVAPCPPLIPQKNKIFRQYLTDDGTVTGDEDMKVDGSVTAVEFWVPASSTADRYITQVSFAIWDVLADLNEFGHIAALGTGCEFKYIYSGGEVIIHAALKTNFDIIRMCRLNPALGSGTSAFKLTNAIGTAECYGPVMDFLTILPPYGLKLDKGTAQKIVVTIQDDITGIDGFDAIAYGFDRLE